LLIVLSQSASMLASCASTEYTAARRGMHNAITATIATIMTLAATVELARSLTYLTLGSRNVAQVFRIAQRPPAGSAIVVTYEYCEMECRRSPCTLLVRHVCARE